MHDLMNTIGPKMPGRRWAAVSVAVALAGAGVVMAAPAASAAPATLVNCATENLQTAITNAPAGATLAVTGTCVGPFTITRGLTITRRGSSATLNGGGTGPVLSISSGASVTLDKLIITNGSADLGGGIDNFPGGPVTLKHTKVTGNTANSTGGGIWNGSSGTMTLESGSTVTGNTAGSGGGIYNSGGTVTMNGSSTVTENTALHGAGGGIFNTEGGTVTMNGGSTASNNTAEALGGGIYNIATVTMNGGSKVIRNTASEGGGIYNCTVADCGIAGTLTGAVAGRNVRDNIPDNIFPAS